MGLRVVPWSGDALLFGDTPGGDLERRGVGWLAEPVLTLARRLGRVVGGLGLRRRGAGGPPLGGELGGPDSDIGKAGRVGLGRGGLSGLVAGSR